MDMDRQLERLKDRYNNQPIPEELDRVVETALRPRNRPSASAKRRSLAYAAGAAAAFVVFVGAMNASPALARTVSGVPGLGGLVEVLTFTEYKVEEGNFEADIRVPAVTHLGELSLEESLNQKYIEEGRRLYDSFMTEMEAQQALGEDGHLSVDSGYMIKAETDRLLSVGRYVETAVGSSETTIQYDTIDKKNRVLLSLASLFADDRYIERISEQIRLQMQEQMEQDESKVYWIDPSDGFAAIAQDQDFYINQDHRLVISFDEYEVAPGYMGVVEFVIPTSAIEDLLVSDEYVK